MSMEYEIFFLLSKDNLPDVTLMEHLLERYDLVNVDRKEFDCSKEQLLFNFFGGDDPENLLSEFIKIDSSHCRVINQSWRPRERKWHFSFSIVSFSGGAILLLQMNRQGLDELHAHFTQSGRSVVNLVSDLFVTCDAKFAIAYGESGLKFSDVVELCLGKKSFNNYKDADQEYRLVAGRGEYDILRLPVSFVYPNIVIYALYPFVV